MARFKDKPFYATGYPDDEAVAICYFGRVVADSEVIAAAVIFISEEKANTINSMNDIIEHVDKESGGGPRVSSRAPFSGGDPIWSADYYVKDRDGDETSVHFYMSDPREMMNFFRTKQNEMEVPQELIDRLTASI